MKALRSTLLRLRCPPLLGGRLLRSNPLCVGNIADHIFQQINLFKGPARLHSLHLQLLLRALLLLLLLLLQLLLQALLGSLRLLLEPLFKLLLLRTRCCTCSVCC